jgi:hypothetical protein
MRAVEAEASPANEQRPGSIVEVVNFIVGATMMCGGGENRRSGDEDVDSI